MTRRQYRQKVNKLIRVTVADMRGAAERLLRGGALDVSSAADDYALATAVMTAVCRREADILRPLTKEGRALAENIELFL